MSGEMRRRQFLFLFYHVGSSPGMLYFDNQVELLRQLSAVDNLFFPDVFIV